MNGLSNRKVIYADVGKMSSKEADNFISELSNLTGCKKRGRLYKSLDFLSWFFMFY